MATLDDIRAICRKLPGAEEGLEERFGFGVMVKGKAKGFVWAWLERVDPKKARVVNNDVIAIRTPNLTAKDLLLASGHPALFTEAHYNGYPAVLVRIAEISPEELEPLIQEAWETVVSRSPARSRRRAEEA